MENPEKCSVKVAVHVRPLIGDERIHGCKECVNVTHGKPQVQIGTHSFTFDHVYGNSGAPSSAMFEECVAPLVDGLFQGYNATVLAYGQTGSGKTYTMGTGSKDISHTGLIPQVMNAMFSKIDTLKHQTEFQLQVSFIEILKEEVRDLLDSVSLNKVENGNGSAGKVTTPGRQSIQIRENSSGAITLSGSTEISVRTLQDMCACLEQGSLSRATGSTNMNNQSSRSHAIFTITVEQMRKIHSVYPGSDTSDEEMGEEYFCAKFHLVDLAGSERAKRTGSDADRLKEGIYINRGLLALGNVISALGDEKKRKDGVHVPYRDSKLTRLLQDSLGGNSKTVMIACISPADVNAEETLNTLKYANRARNIQNKPVVNRDLISSELQRMQLQLEYLQAELAARGGPASSNELQVLRERTARLESTNQSLSRQLHECRSRRALQSEFEAQDDTACFPKSDGLKRGFHSIDSSDCETGDIISAEIFTEVDVVTKEKEHELLRNTMDEELNELNKRLEQKESEMKLFGGFGTETLKQLFGKKILELEEEKRVVQQERDLLLAEVESLAADSDGQAHRAQEIHSTKLKSLEAQIIDLRKKKESQVQLVKEKHKSEEAAKRLQAEIHYIKAQKVQLQHKIKQEAEQFRTWKASREKELLQLKKEGRRNEYERHKLEALNQRQRMVLQRKTEEAAMATKRLKELLENRKSAIRNNSTSSNGHSLASQNNDKSLQRWLDHEVEVVVNVHEVRYEYDKQTQVRAALAEELTLLKQVDRLALEGNSPPSGNSRYSRMLSLSPESRKARAESIENMLSMSSNALISMASQLSELEERDRSFFVRGRLNQLRAMGDAKNLLQHMFNSAAEARCQLWERDIEIKDMKDQLNDLVTLLRINETQRIDFLREQKAKEQAILAKVNSRNSLKHLADDTSDPLSVISVPAPKQLKFTPGIVNGSVRESAAFINQTKKMVPMGQISMKKLASMGQAGTKLWRWKRSHHQWLMQFKWKWQKPWRLSEWIKHTDETIIKPRPRSHPQL